jgi:zinc transport system substrate-binding protein
VRYTKFAVRIFFVFFPIFIAASCSGNAKRGSGGRLSVVASFCVMADFAQKLGGERVTVRTLIPAGQDTHDWEPSPRDIAALESSDVFIYSGAGFEPWVPGVLAALSNKNIVAIDAGAGIDTIPGDPHVWLSPLCAKTQLKNIAGGLTQAAGKRGFDSVYAKDFADAYDEYAALCENLDAEYRSSLGTDFAHRYIIAVHAAFGYLSREYALTQIGVTAGNGDDPDPLSVRRIIDFARTQGVTAIFYEEAGNRRIAEAIAREIGGSAVFLNPLESLLPQEIRAGDDYFSVMKKNLAVLSDALAAE